MTFGTEFLIIGNENSNYFYQIESRKKFKNKITFFFNDIIMKYYL